MSFLKGCPQRCSLSLTWGEETGVLVAIVVCLWSEGSWRGGHWAGCGLRYLRELEFGLMPGPKMAYFLSQQEPRG